jgi:aminoglycoside phosphotransferase (APT) family kinase protein
MTHPTVDGGAPVIGPKVGDGREAEVFMWGDDAVVKLYRPGFAGYRAESAALATLDGCGLAPQLLEVVDYAGRPGLVLQRLDGSDMLNLLQSQPWRMLGLARALAGAHRVVHGVHAPAGLPDLRQLLATRIDDAVLTPQLRTFAMRVLDGLPAGDQLCHGDYHPGNVLVAADRTSVIDWTNASRGVPEADVARTALLLRYADPLPGTPPLRRGLMAAGRSVFARAYMRAYGGGSPRPPGRLDSWTVVNAAARLAEGIEAEQPALSAVLERAWRRTAA